MLWVEKVGIKKLINITTITKTTTHEEVVYGLAQN
jgi:hypothetical protein